MAKRFTDTNKYKKPFIRSLEGAYKLLWDYLYHDCDHAGIWIVDFDIAQIYIGSDMPVNKEDALRYFNKDEQRVIEIDGGKKWFIPSFTEFQYGELNETNRAHKSAIQILKKHNLYNKGLKSSLNGAIVKDKEKDKVKEREKEFKKKVFELKNEYSDELLEKFFNYWSQHGENDRLMLFEKQKSFEIKKRLQTWKRNEEKFSPTEKNKSDKNGPVKEPSKDITTTWD